MREATFEARLADAITETYAASLPAIALHALWSAHRIDHVYALSRALPIKQSARTLAFYAGQDPKPRDERAVRAAKDAIRLALMSNSHAEVLAMVPLRDEAVIRAAERLARERRRITPLLRLRLHPESASIPSTDPNDPDTTHILGAAATKHHREGRPEDARTALSDALNTAKTYPDAVLPLLPVIQSLDAFDLLMTVGFPLLGDASFFHAAFLAGSAATHTSLNFVEKLMAEGASPYRMGVLAAASLGKRDIPPEWHPHLTGSPPENIQELWDEGLISHDERWAAITARHLAESGLSTGSDAALTAMLEHAHKATSAYSTKLLEEWDREPLPPKESHSQRRLEKLVAESLTRGRANLFMLARLCRQAADKAKPELAAEALQTLEKTFGKATTWDGGIQFPSDAELWITTLASAKGRSQEALPLLETHPDTDIEARTCLCAGLARDGHKEALQSIWPSILKAPMSADQLRRILHAAHVMAPDSLPALQETTQQTLESLPGTPESIAAWLSARDEDEIDL